MFIKTPNERNIKLIFIMSVIWSISKFDLFTFPDILATCPSQISRIIEITRYEQKSIKFPLINSLQPNTIQVNEKKVKVFGVIFNWLNNLDNGKEKYESNQTIILLFAEGVMILFIYF